MHRLFFRGMPHGTCSQCGELDIPLYEGGRCYLCYAELRLQRSSFASRAEKSCLKCEAKIDLSETRCTACWNKRRDKKIERLEKRVDGLARVVLRLNAPALRIELNDPWFGLVESGAKRYEGRRSTPRLKALKPGDKVVVDHHTDLARPPFTATVVNVLDFPTFEAALRILPLEAVLPGVKTVEEGVEIYKKFVSVATQEREGVLMIELDVPAKGT